MPSTAASPGRSCTAGWSWADSVWSRSCSPRWSPAGSAACAPPTCIPSWSSNLGSVAMDGRSRRRADTRQKLYEANVAKDTVYYNFKSKTDLFEELLRHGVGLLTQEFRTAVEGLPPREAVRALVRAQLS